MILNTLCNKMIVHVYILKFSEMQYEFTFSMYSKFKKKDFHLDIQNESYPSKWRQS